MILLFNRMNVHAYKNPKNSKFSVFSEEGEVHYFFTDRKLEIKWDNLPVSFFICDIPEFIIHKLREEETRSKGEMVLTLYLISMFYRKQLEWVQ